MSSKKIAKAGIISAIYVVLSIITFPIASGIIQIRLSEGLCLLPLLFPESILGISIGCLLVNIITGCAVYDIFLGSLVTFVSALLTFIIGKIIKKEKLRIAIGGIFPVILNALVLPVIWIFIAKTEVLYLTTAVSIFISQTISVYVLGIPLYIFTKKINKKHKI